MLKIKLMGHTSIRFNGKNITNDFSRKNIALLFLLIVNENKYVTKDKLALYLWPESSEESSKYNVRYNLWMLNKNLPKDSKGNEFIISDKNSCTINLEYEFECDLLSILRCNCTDAEIETLNGVVETAFSGEVMEGWYINHCYEFNELIMMHRMQIEKKQIMILKALSQMYMDKNKFDNALNVLRKAEAVDPTDENTAKNILNIYCMLGDRVSGINYYKSFEARLWKDLSIMPNDELQSIYEKLLSKGGITVEKNKPAREKNTLNLFGFGTASIEWSLVSSIIDSLAKNICDGMIEKMNPDVIKDLSYINKKLLFKYNKITGDKIEGHRELPAIRIMQAFSELLETASELYDLTIEIDGYEGADTISKEVITYIGKTLRDVEISK